MSKDKNKDTPLPDNAEERDEEFVRDAAAQDDSSKVIHLSGMYRNYFLDYASYVILERAVPMMEDGLKPVQRRILHSLWELDDGRYNKVANVIGNTMKYHPHGDASIGDAMVQMGQKDLLIDTQGNWGNIYTGDSAAAPRYIEARLSKFALAVAFNPKTTEWQPSYDGRNKEPVTLPAKFPLLLAQGAEGIAVGLACKFLPHNFNELIDASIGVLRGKNPKLVPDFPTGGMADFSLYNEGVRGGRVRVRAKINQMDKKTLVITEIPFGTTTETLIDSILKANDKGKIKVRKVEDNTAENVEILIHLAADVSPDKTIDALYAFTDCELSVSPNSCIIDNGKPVFLSVNEILKNSTRRTLDLVQLELQIQKKELEEQWHLASLEKIFIEKRIYRDIEKCETYEAIISTIHKGLKPYTKKLIRVVTDEDVTKLTEIKIKRISKFDSTKADENISKLEEDITQVKHHLRNLVEYATEYFKDLKKRFGEGRDRKTEIKSFDTIEAAKVAVANVKLYVDRQEGFAGYNLKKTEAELVCECSDIDDVIAIRRDGVMTVTRIAEKFFVGKDILHIGIWKRDDSRTTYNMIYRDGQRGAVMMKRFSVTSVIRDKEYYITKGTPDSEILYLTANPNGEAEVITVILKEKSHVRKLKFDMDFAQLAIKGRDAQGNILSKNPVSKIVQKEKGISTLGARKIWFDDTVMRLNDEGRGQLLGEFSGEDKILYISQSGHYKLTGFDLSTHFDEDIILIEKWNSQRPVSAVYLDGEKKLFFAKRFLVEETDRKVCFISEHSESLLEIASTVNNPIVELYFRKEKEKDKERNPERINLAEFITVKGLKAIGNRISPFKVKSIDLLPSPDEIQPEVATDQVVPTHPHSTLRTEKKSARVPVMPLNSLLDLVIVPQQVTTSKVTKSKKDKNILKQTSKEVKPSRVPGAGKKKKKPIPATLKLPFEE